MLENVSRFEVDSIGSVSRGRCVRIKVMDLITHLMLLHAKIEELFEFTSKVGLYIKQYRYTGRVDYRML